MSDHSVELNAATPPRSEGRARRDASPLPPLFFPVFPILSKNALALFPHPAGVFAKKKAVPKDILVLRVCPSPARDEAIDRRSSADLCPTAFAGRGYPGPYDAQRFSSYALLGPIYKGDTPSNAGVPAFSPLRRCESRGASRARVGARVNKKADRHCRSAFLAPPRGFEPRTQWLTVARERFH